MHFDDSSEFYFYQRYVPMLEAHNYMNKCFVIHITKRSGSVTQPNSGRLLLGSCKGQSIWILLRTIEDLKSQIIGALLVLTATVDFMLE
jgi:hypothetical protein